MMTLTKKQKLIFDYIENYVSNNGISPTLEEIRKALNLKAVSTVHEHVTYLKKKKYLSTAHDASRCIMPRIGTKRILEIPIVGKIAAGLPIEAIEDYQDIISIVNPNIKDPKDYYALRVDGDSMVEDGIFSGDIVVLRKQSDAIDGDTVVAIIDDNEATLKKIYKEKKGYRLEPCNQGMLPFFRKEVEVRGVVVQVVRDMFKRDDAIYSTDMENSLKSIDLFAGIGGNRIGFESIGVKTVFTSEWDTQAQKTYYTNFKEMPFGDITKIKPEEIPPFDILLAGFPCQPFSQAGKKRGLADARGTLFFDIAKILEYHRPRVVFLENVKRFRSHDQGRTYETVTGILRQLGYNVFSKVINAKDFGVPQNRERIFIIGFLGKTDFAFPEPLKKKCRLGSILEKNVDKKYTLSDKLWEGHQRRKKMHIEKGNGFGYSIFDEKSEYTSTISARYYKDGSEILLRQEGGNPRKLTPREAARLQGFPDTFKIPVSDAQAYKQFGNSVAVPVITALAREVLKSIQRLEKKSNSELNKVDIEKIKKVSINRVLKEDSHSEKS